MPEILARKERERRANGGLFLWGIGNAVGPGMRELLRRSSDPSVLFSPIKSRPRAADASPPRVAAWTAAETMDGQPYELPSGSVVTSRLDRDQPKASHYALVCRVERPLQPEEAGLSLDFCGLRNLTTGSCLGSSQVTAVVETTGDICGADRDRYPVAWRARLAWPYFVRLHEPRDIDLQMLLRTVRLAGDGPVRLATIAPES